MKRMLTVKRAPYAARSGSLRPCRITMPKRATIMFVSSLYKVKDRNRREAASHSSSVLLLKELTVMRFVGYAEL
jgi:hypothetical protein